MTTSDSGTLGYLLDHGYQVDMHCEACGRHAWLDLDVVVAKLGRDYSYLARDLNHKLICGSCGSKRVRGYLHPPAPKVHMNWHGGE